jgi:hypothetical protein
MLEGTAELLEPFASESIFTEALIDSTFRNGIGKMVEECGKKLMILLLKFKKEYFM